MSSQLLDKLKRNNKPKTKTNVTVSLGPAKSVKLKTTVVDKSGLKAIDRSAFMKDLKKTVIAPAESVAKIDPTQKTMLDMDKPEPKLSKIMEEQVESDEKKETDAAPPKQKITIKVKRKTKKVKLTGDASVRRTTAKKKESPIGVAKDAPFATLKIGDTILKQRLGEKKEALILRASDYYMNNRKIFVDFITSRFSPYKKELEDAEKSATCDYTDDGSFSPMAHQKIVRDYINQYTPYRGLLLYHGLGSGKTCSSIAIAEGIKSNRQIIVMTPASLRTNYIEELKKCGDSMYRKNQFWEFIDTTGNTDLEKTLSAVLSISVEFIRKNKGAWLVNIKKPSNFSDLNSSEKKSLDLQLDEMIRHKYRFINYNGLRKANLKTLTSDYTKNPFDNSAVIIDEAHNFVSRIVNKLSSEDSLSMKLYEYLMDAQNTKVVFLTGTPIINYPNEISVMFNILRGRIETWSFPLTINEQRKINLEFFKKLFKSTVLGGNILDFMDYKSTSTTLVITRNPFGFVNNVKSKVYEGVHLDDTGNLSNEDFVKTVTEILKKNRITVNAGGVKVSQYKALPDDLEGFKSYFINASNEVVNMDLFKRRILGLSSYFRSAQENLMPKYTKGENFHIIKVPMSDFQFGVYEEARIQERQLEMRNARKKKKQKDGIYENTVSTYRIFSRAFCNFVFPRPDIKRPMPGGADDLSSAILETTANEDLLDAKLVQEKLQDVDGKYDADELGDDDDVDTKTYNEQITEALKKLEDSRDEYLSPTALETYSPKFLNMLQNIENPKHKGLHLIYSQFRTLEGVGIMQLVLEANGFARFRLKRVGDRFEIDTKDEDLGKPYFALYTGTETPEEKELIRNIFNGMWDFVPPHIREKLEEISSDNKFGEIIKVLMITASGAEGISLKNVRYVHITEPYWHPVRIEQVIGRARRICSHKDLPKELQTVDVFLYLMTFTEKQLESDDAVTLRLKDKSKKDGTPLTSDESLYEISTMKEEITSQILTAVKEASIDCALHSKVSGEKLKCFSFGTDNPDKFSFQPSISSEEKDTVAKVNKTKIKWKAVKWVHQGKSYAYNKETRKVYDLEKYMKGEVEQVGRIDIDKSGEKPVYVYKPL